MKKQALIAMDGYPILQQIAGEGRGRSFDETVSPELGRALLQLSAGNAAEATGRASTQGPPPLPGVASAVRGALAWAQRDGAVVSVTRCVVEADQNRHADMATY